jgi:hypothetical protein
VDTVQDFGDLLDPVLLAIKERIDHPRHREDARVLRKVLERRRRP